MSLEFRSESKRGIALPTHVLLAVLRLLVEFTHFFGQEYLGAEHAGMSPRVRVLIFDMLVQSRLAFELLLTYVALVLVQLCP